MESESVRSDQTVSGPAPWLPCAVFFGLTIIITIPILLHIDNWGVRDWDLFTTLHAAAVRSILDYHQFPFWNPYIGGGNILFAHPEVSVLNPFFILLLVFGPVVGLKLQVLVILFLGLLGGYRLARCMEIGLHGSVITAVGFMLSSYLMGHIAAGHLPFHFFAGLPWLIFFYKKSLIQPIQVLSAAVVAALMILGSGAAVPFLFSMFFLFLFSLCDLGHGYGIRPPLYVIASGIGAILFSAVKFFPMADYLSRHPWIPEQTVQTTPLWIFPSMFFHPNQSIFARHIGGAYTWGWHEYGAYIGPFVFALAVFALVRNFRANWRYLALILVSIILALGSLFPPYSPWDILHQLPGFASTRVPSRLILLAVIAFAILAGKGVDQIMSLIRTRRSIAGWGIVALICMTHLAVIVPIMSEIFTRTPEKPTPGAYFKQTEGNPNRMYAAFLQNEGTIRAAWLSAYLAGRGILMADNSTQEWYSPDDRVIVHARLFSPNRIGFDVSSETGGTLVISQGYDVGWQRSDGGKIIPYADLVALEVAPQTSTLEIYYRPEYFTAGWMVSSLSIIGAMVFWRRYRMKRNLTKVQIA